MATTNKPSYNLDWLKQNAQAGFGISDIDLKKYGIDYSEEDRNNIAKIFQDSATAAYKQAQTNFSNIMAQEQATLQDTLRRSQAEAVATGASRGMQAANE